MTTNEGSAIFSKVRKDEYVTVVLNTKEEVTGDFVSYKSGILTLRVTDYSARGGDDKPLTHLSRIPASSIAYREQ